MYKTNERTNYYYCYYYYYYTQYFFSRTFSYVKFI